MSKPRSFRLTGDSELRLEQLQDKLRLDNPNMTLNRIIRDYYLYEKYAGLIEELEKLLKKD